MQKLARSKGMDCCHERPYFVRASAMWCSGGDSNPHGLLHTPLKRARLPITPPERIGDKAKVKRQNARGMVQMPKCLIRSVFTKSYFLAGDFAGALLAGALAVGLFAAGAEFTAVLAFASFLNSSVAGVSINPLLSAGGVLAFAPAVLELASAELVFASVVTGASGLLDKTEMLPVNAGIARNRADNINVVAATIVTLESTVAVPRGLNAELDTLLVNNAPASVLPGCSKTAATSTMHERKNIPYKK